MGPRPMGPITVISPPVISQPLVPREQQGRGRRGASAAGPPRLQGDQWLPDAPYPKATLPDLDGTPLTEARRDLMAEAERLIRKALAYKAELSERTAMPATFELAEDAAIAAW